MHACPPDDEPLKWDRKIIYISKSLVSRSPERPYSGFVVGEGWRSIFFSETPSRGVGNTHTLYKINENQTGMIADRDIGNKNGKNTVGEATPRRQQNLCRAALASARPNIENFPNDAFDRG